MPIFMDRHDIPGATAQSVAMAHQKDVAIQGRYGCRALTYWYDQERGAAFCLIEAPSQNAVAEMHRNAHGLVPNKIIAVDKALVEGFLGRITDPVAAEAGVTLPVISEPAFRTVLTARAHAGPVAALRYGEAVASELLEEFRNYLARSTSDHAGSLVRSTSSEITASFFQASDAMDCAVEVTRALSAPNVREGLPDLELGIGIAAGQPVGSESTLFRKVIDTASNLCSVSRKRRTLVSSAVRTEATRDQLLSVMGSGAAKVLTAREEQFLEKLMAAMRAAISDEDFRIEALDSSLGSSRSQVFRNTHSITGFSPNELLREIRLASALDRLERGEGTVSEIAYDCGFASPAYFSRCYVDRYRVRPSAHLEWIHLHA